jgi:hypothetical protein
MTGTPRTDVRNTGSRVVRLTPEHRFASTGRKVAGERPDQCAKCGSRYIRYEPAFIHCRYCGRIAPIAGASLLEQELYELRSGLRIAS